MNKAQKILDAQLSLAQGQQFLYRIDTTIDKKGKKTRSKPILVINSKEISDYIDGEYGNGESLDTETEFYFITTKEPSNLAIDSMFNRTFGKPTENVDIKSGGEKINIFDDKQISKIARRILNGNSKGKAKPD